MTAISDLCTTVRGWLNLGPDVYPDAVVTSWVRMAEEWMSENLRVKHMIQIDWQAIAENRTLLPSDWQELDTVRFRNGDTLIYSPREEFNAAKYYNKNRYTIIGNYILVGTVDNISGTEVEISYYQSIPPLEEVPNWALKYMSRLYVLCTCWHASMYAIEDDRGEKWKNDVFTFTNDVNEKHKISKSSGSVLISRKKKGFG